MSPRRRVRRQLAVQRSTRDYALVAIAILAVAAGTALAIWLIRPGGAAAEQPRIATVIAGCIVVFIMSYSISGTPDRPVVGRGALWGGVAFLAACIVSGGAMLQEIAGWKHALEISVWIGGGVIVFAALCECMLLIRHWAAGQQSLRILLSLALTLIVGAIAALAWPGGIKISNPPDTPGVPNVPSSSVTNPIPTLPPTSTTP